MKSAKIVVTSHGLEHRSWKLAKEEHRLGRSRIGIRSWIARPMTIVWPSIYAIRNADFIFCLNSEDELWLNQILGVGKQKILRIYPGADVAYLSAYGRRDSARPKPTILWFGTWITRKGTVDFTAAFQRVVMQYPLTRLRIIGAGLPKESILRTFTPSLHDQLEILDKSSFQMALIMLKLCLMLRSMFCPVYSKAPH